MYEISKGGAAVVGGGEGLGVPGRTDTGALRAVTGAGPGAFAHLTQPCPRGRTRRSLFLSPVTEDWPDRGVIFICAPTSSQSAGSA